MNKLRFYSLLCLAFWLPLVCQVAAAEPPDASAKTRVLVVTGGHGFENQPFFQVFKDNVEITFQAAEHPKAQALLKAAPAKDYDVLVLYDMYQPATPEVQADFVARLKEGKGLVVLHHAIASYQAWPEYAKIIGAKYYLEPTVVAGVEKKRSGYKHDMKFTLHVADTNHPVTRGLKDFEIHDETYKWFDVAPECHTLLTTTEPESNPVVAWTKTYEAARVVYLQSGHDHFAFENPNFRKLLQQAIRWAARKD